MALPAEPFAGLLRFSVAGPALLCFRACNVVVIFLDIYRGDLFVTSDSRTEAEVQPRCSNWRDSRESVMAASSEGGIEIQAVHGVGSEAAERRRHAGRGTDSVLVYSRSCGTATDRTRGDGPEGRLHMSRMWCREPILGPRGKCRERQVVPLSHCARRHTQMGETARSTIHDRLLRPGNEGLDRATRTFGSTGMWRITSVLWVLAMAASLGFMGVGAASVAGQPPAQLDRPPDTVASDAPDVPAACTGVCREGPFGCLHPGAECFDLLTGCGTCQDVLLGGPCVCDPSSGGGGGGDDGDEVASGGPNPPVQSALP